MTGAVVVGDADAGQLWRRGVMGHGAIGVISGAIGEYVNPDPPGAKPTPRETWNILQWSSIPYDEAKKGFGFKATPHAMTTLRQSLKAGAVTVRVTIASTFSTKPARTLVAEIPGRDAPDERVVIAVHVQEPGANDNASGVATLAEVARALSLGIQQGRIPPPGRTLTLLWLDEIGGSRQWLTSHADAAKNVKYMFSMDMTGEDVKKTGGSFLIERWPDPGAVWERPWDPHTEWGQGNVRADRLKGDLLNDLHLAVCLRVARKTGWVVNTNPYEGGSDHTVFGTRGHSVRARLALHGSLLPHEHGHRRQVERAGDAQRRRVRGRRRRGCSRQRPSRRRSPWPIWWRRPAARAWRSRSAKARIWRPPTRTRVPHVCEKTRSSRRGSSGTRKRSRRSRGWWSGKRRRRFGRSSSNWPRRSTAP